MISILTENTEILPDMSISRVHFGDATHLDIVTDESWSWHREERVMRLAEDYSGKSTGTAWISYPNLWWLN